MRTESKTARCVAPVSRLSALTQLVDQSDSAVHARFGAYRLSSAYQPVFSLSHRRVVGHEALMRARHGEQFVNPLGVFDSAVSDEETTLLDRLCRLMHVRNYTAPIDGWLFLNVNPVVTLTDLGADTFFQELLESVQLPPHRIVVELLEDAVPHDSALSQSLDAYRAQGCLIAIDDFGAGSSNFDRIWRLRPDIVKLDRSIVVEAAENGRARRMLPGLVALLHEAGCLVLAEGIETREQALIAMEADADLVQGYLFGRPSEQPVVGCPNDEVAGLCREFRQWTADASRREVEQQKYTAVVEVAAGRLAAGQDLTAACAELLSMPRVRRCFMLDADGNQLAANLESFTSLRRADPRYQPLRSAVGANWFRRPYFRRAVARPGVVQVTRPYFSVTDIDLCFTVSLQMRLNDKDVVFCCDISHDTEF